MIIQHPTQTMYCRQTPSVPLLENPFNKPKRYAIYIPQSFFDQARKVVTEAEAEDASTWEFSATTPSVHETASSSTISSTASSPAKEIVIRYRAGIPLELDDEAQSDTSAGHEHDFDEDDPTVFYTPVEHEEALQHSLEESRVTEKEITEIKLIYRQSCRQALDRTREEALRNMRSQGLEEGDPIICHRPGCSDTLRNARDLMFHLHIHDIHDRSLHGNQQNTHFSRCFSGRINFLVTPLKSILSDLFLKIMHRNR